MSYPLAVLMAVRNVESYIQEAVESILNQTYRDFELVIVDDESTDKTRNIISTYNDPRIRLIALPKNVGQTAALNIGLKTITSPWIARMDGDDVCAPTRFEEQMALIEQKPWLTCVGTHAWVFRNDPSVFDEVWERPPLESDIKRDMLKAPSIIHGSIVVNRDKLIQAGAYNERYRYSADFEMYERLVTRDARVENIPKTLLGIRRHPNQDSRSVRAVDETIEIFLNRLSGSRYSKQEKHVIRSALAFFYLLRVRFWIRQKKYNMTLLNDLGKSFRTSPLTVLRHLSYVPAELYKLWVPRGVR